MHNFTPRLFIVVGSPASGKDELISAVNTIGVLHAEIVPKHTDRDLRFNDGDEMICMKKYISDNSLVDNENYDLKNCDVKYVNFKKNYGIKTSEIWDKLRDGINQVAVVSDSGALNQLKNKFGNLAVVLYVYSQINKSTYRKREIANLKSKKQNLTKEDEEYIKERVADFDKAWNLYIDNFLLFDHVLIYADRQEELFDQIFRLFKAYENGTLK